MPPSLRRAGMFLLVLAASAAAQFAELATTDDGSQLYFISKMLLKGREPGPWPESRLYRFGLAGVTLVAERGALAPHDSGSSSDGVSRPSVSGDGSVVGFTYTGICSDPQCASAGDRIEIRGRDTLTLPPGFVQISRNGRWALVNAIGNGTSTFVDLSSGQRTVVPLWPIFTNGGLRNVRLASDGSFLAGRSIDVSPGLTRNERGIWKAGQFTPLNLPDHLLPFGLVDDGTVVLAWGTARAVPSYGQLLSVSLASGTVTTIVDVAGPTQYPAFLGASNDGRRVLYRIESILDTNGPAYVWDAATRTGALVPLAPGEWAADGVLTGNGALAFIATTRGRIVRFDVASKTIADLFPPTHRCDDSAPLAGGSFARLTCNFTSSAVDLQGKLVLDGSPVPVLYSTAAEIGVQVPWRTFPPSTLTYDLPGDSPFRPSQDVRIYDGAPAIVSAESGLFGMKIVKGDWSGLVTAVPSPGDTFHIYMTGLGWTANPETTGVPASLVTPNPIQWRLGCEFLPDRQPVDLLFAGLAPGMLGIYQASFRMPAGAAQSTSFRCALQSPVMTVMFGPGLPVPFVYGSGIAVGPLTPPPPPR